MSGRPYFDNGRVIERMQTAPEPKKRGRFVYGEGPDLKPVEAQWQDDGDGEALIWEEPKEGWPYVIGGDTAGDGSDRFTAIIIDNVSGEQVAQLKYAGGSELWYTQQLWCLGRYYNTALIGAEINFSTYAERKLEEWGYEKLYVREKPDDVTRELNVRKFGWRTDMRTRPLILANLQTIVRQATEWIRSRDLLGEMLTFVRDENERPAAAEGEHDDLVMAAAIAWHIRTQQATRPEQREPERVRWTRDQWEDYDRADSAQREMLVRLWGEPRR